MSFHSSLIFINSRIDARASFSINKTGTSVPFGNKSTILTVLQHVRLHHVKVADVFGMCQERYCGFNRKPMTNLGRGVPTVWNVADIGTKCLQQKRLFLLMYESGLIYLSTFESVGEQEYQEQAKKTGYRNQLHKLTKVFHAFDRCTGP